MMEGNQILQDAQSEESEIWRTDAPAPNYGYYVIIVTMAFFFLLSKVVMLIAPAALKTDSQLWKWKNISLSFFHAVICSCWTMYCFYERPDMTDDVISIFTTVSHSLISFSVGYFLYDLIDLMVYNPTRESFEVAAHHVAVIACFMVGVTSRRYISYAVIALLVEVNSVFLHMRQLLKMWGLNKLNPWCRLNSVINLGTFIVFRLLLLAWMIRWLILNRHLLPFIFYTMYGVTLGIMVIINVVLLSRLIRSDFISVKNKERVS